MTGNGARVSHVPVLLEEVLDGLHLRQGGVYLDGTVGAGGHAAGILSRCQEVRVVGLDRDPEALKLAAENLAGFGNRVRLVHGDFKDLAEILSAAGIGMVDGIVLDLGVSSMQLDQPERGFSFMNDGPLDMRMDPASDQPASLIVNTWRQKDLTRLLRTYGEEKKARDIAAAIVRERGRDQITTTARLARIVAEVPGMDRVRNIHPATRTFQALRIEVNGELEALKKVIPEGIAQLSEGGRMAVISFHSLEDRIIKKGFRDQENPCRCPRELHECRCGAVATGRVITRRPILASQEEIGANPRSRSAKLRIFEKKGEGEKEKVKKGKGQTNDVLVH